ncbi:MAG: alpha/beta hydrolase, partial [Anaeroplasmataceae bacterium]|nr:alpha/beta hydrolase [Anaeroplasmataceae bacterium]
MNTYYHATDEAKLSLISTEEVTVEKKKNAYIFKPSVYEMGIIFYPGAKVEASAYAPLLHMLAQNGILCILCEMPFRLAVLNINAAKHFYSQYEIKKWYLAGHSLGGAMASSYLSKHSNTFEGLILLAAYSTSDISNLNLEVFSIYGENDQVLDKKKYEKNLTKLHKDFKEFQIDGGCHAYFGNYGKQLKDGEPTISNLEQIKITVDYL